MDVYETNIKEMKLGIICENCGGENTYLHDQSPEAVIWCSDCRHTIGNGHDAEQFVEDIKQIEQDRLEP